MQTANYCEVNHSISVLFFFHTAIKLFGSKFHENLTGKTICTRTGSLQTNKIIREFFRLVLSSALLMIWCFGHPTPSFLRLASNAFPDIGSVGRIEKDKSITRSLGIGGLVPQHHCLEPGPKINMAEKLVDVIVKLRQRGKKDQPPKHYVVTMPIFQMNKKTIQSEKMV